MSLTKPLIVAAKMDASSFEFFDDLRRRYFPPERNFLAAHITLFHHLPGDEIATIENDLESAASDCGQIELAFTGARFFGRGTAIEIDAPGLFAVRRELAGKWEKYLLPQDRQRFKPHITVQNKTAPDEAKILFEKLKADWQNRKGSAVGLHLWHYLGGPWQLANEFMFREKTN